jgi:hypothetical protein
MTLSQMQALCSQRLNEAAAPIFYPDDEITRALNEADRTFCLLTLALETTATWTPTATFTHMLTVFSDFLVPLRIATLGGVKIRPSRFNDLWALDASWPSSPTQITRYVAAGADLIAVYPAQATTLNVTYARAPVAMVNAGDVPEIPAEYHIQLVNYAIYRLRQVEGGLVLASVLPLLDEYLASAKEYGAWMRARHLGANYDTLPAEFALYDRSRRVATAAPEVAA